jgi:hypothetical protein
VRVRPQIRQCPCPYERLVQRTRRASGLSRSASLLMLDESRIELLRSYIVSSLAPFRVEIGVDQ